MIQQIVIGAGFAFAAAVQPGPLQAYLFSRAASLGWRRTLPAACAPLLSDGPIALLALFVLGKLSPAMQTALRAAGGAFLFFLAWKIWRQWKGAKHGAPPKTEKAPNTFMEAALVNLLNPNPYLAWALILGPTVAAAWREGPANGVALVAAFYFVMVATLGAIVMAFGSTKYLGPGVRQKLLPVSGIILGGLGAYQLVQVVLGLL